MNKDNNVSVAKIYDKISTHVRALETLGVKTKLCATMLHPLMKSSLPEEILQTCQRSSASSEVTAATPGQQKDDRLTKLLKFLETEVENEERISLAVNGFSVQTTIAAIERRDNEKENCAKSTSSVEPTSASALFSGGEKRNKCIFCNDMHGNAVC
ncbi:hypothetical protein QAD02_012571 [Eretmocerus hayati]|uniref:Uncharacterized protein n=1 Tax=Eretmocerus hayati TaxID=131215 RepID=A0ACC2P0C5_9HYME|nr:hypothetical protein QAD02_012571 [Eretmocerus hayati]